MALIAGAPSAPTPPPAALPYRALVNLFTPSYSGPLLSYTPGQGVAAELVARFGWLVGVEVEAA